MVRIRLRGSRIVVIDQRKARDGEYTENIGRHNNQTDPPTQDIKDDRALYWLNVGAQPSDAVRRIFERSGTYDRFQSQRNREEIEDRPREAEANKQELPSQKTSRRFEDSEPQKPKTPLNKEAREPDAPPPADDDMIPEVVPDLIPEPTPDPLPVADESPQPNDSEAKQPLSEAAKNKGTLYGDLNRPGATELSEDPYPPEPVKDPEFRANRSREDLRNAIRNEPPVEERRRQVLTTRWDGKDPATRNFLKFQYNGKCQICCDVFARRDGEPYFEALYIETYTTAKFLDRPANTLCLCPNHVARFLHGSRIFKPDFRQQVLSYTGPGEHEINLELCGETVRVRFSEGHIIDLKKLVEETADDAAS